MTQQHWQHAPRRVPFPAPVRIEPVPGEGFGLAILPPPTRTSGVAVGSMVTGIGSILVAAVVWCFGLIGADGGWGGLVSGAFCVLAVLLGVAGLALGGVGLRQIRRHTSITGRGSAITGMICGGAGILLAVAGVIVAVALAQNAVAT